jgi:hypothetical protein
MLRTSQAKFDPNQYQLATVTDSKSGRTLQEPIAGAASALPIRPARPIQQRLDASLNTLFTVKLAHDLRNLLTIMAKCVESIQALRPMRAVGELERAFAELDGAIDSAFAVSRELLALGMPQAARERNGVSGRWHE